MAHPMAGQAKASEKRRLGYLNAKAGKPWGSSKMYKKKGYPSKNAGSSTPMTISGGASKKRPDRFAGGGAVGKKRKGHHTTNIVISAPGGSGGHGGGGGFGRGAPGAPVPVPRPVPVPVRPPAAPPMAAGPGGPGGLPPALAGGIGAPPIAPRPMVPPMRPPVPGGPGAPGLPGMKAGGVVKKQIGGGVGAGAGGRAYRGFPNSPTTAVDSAVSAHKKGGAAYAFGGNVKKKKNGGDDDSGDSNGDGNDDTGQNILEQGSGGDTGPPDAMSAAQQNLPQPPSGQKHGGRVKKRQYGGVGGAPRAARPGAGSTSLLQVPTAARPMGPQRGAPTISGAQARPALPLPVPLPSTAAALRARPAPGTRVGFKKGGSPKHDDEAQDKKLFRKMIKEEEKHEKE